MEQLAVVVDDVIIDIIYADQRLEYYSTFTGEHCTLLPLESGHTYTVGMNYTL